MLFRSTSHLLPGDPVIVNADWPATCNGEPLVLVLQGHIIRTIGSMMAMTIARHSLVVGGASMKGGASEPPEQQGEPLFHTADAAESGRE